MDDRMYKLAKLFLATSIVAFAGLLLFLSVLAINLMRHI